MNVQKEECSWKVCNEYNIKEVIFNFENHLFCFAYVRILQCTLVLLAGKDIMKYS